MKRLSILALLLSGCNGCDDAGGLSELRPRIEVEPELLALGDVPVGAVGRGTVTVRNRGDLALSVEEVTIDDRFTVEGGADVLPPGASAALVVTARAEAVEFYDAQLRIASDDPARPVIRVRVTMLGVEPPPCDDGNVCTEDRFDPEQGGCVHSFADGLPCSPADRCVIDARCSLGVCLGRSKVCDDENPCTRNLCRQVDGECVFLETPDICDDQNPCTADVCTPEGCLHEPVPSGTSCDDGDACTVGDACFFGRCEGAGVADGEPCDDGDSCTTGDLCQDGVCAGTSIVASAQEGDIVFEHPLVAWQERAFLHRREVSLGNQGTFYGLDHLDMPPGEGLTHVVFALRQCGTIDYQFSYRPTDGNVFVSYVRRAIQVRPNDQLRMVVGVRQRPDDGFRPQTTAYVLDERGRVRLSQIERLGGETGRSLLPDGSEVYGVVFPLTNGPPTPEVPSRQNLVVVREDAQGNVLWRHERASGHWSEFLGVAGPRVLFWASGRFGALDFNTGATVWSQETPFTSDEMALSTGLNLGVIRTKPTIIGEFGQLIGVEILEGRQIFQFPATPSDLYYPRTEPVIDATGRIGVMMQRNLDLRVPSHLEWVELDATGQVLFTTRLPYTFPEEFGMTRHEDFRDDPFPTVADDGIVYVGYGDQFWALNPNGGGVRWSLQSSLSADAFTGTVPLLRDDGVLLISEASRRIIGVRTNGGRMSEDGWASFRHDGRRTNYTPPATP